MRVVSTSAQGHAARSWQGDTVARSLPGADHGKMEPRWREESRVPNESEIIQRDAGILGGTPKFRGTRVPIQGLFDHLEAGESLDGFLADFPTVTREMAVAVLELAREGTRQCACCLASVSRGGLPESSPDMMSEQFQILAGLVWRMASS